MGHQTPQNPASRRHHVPEGEVRAAKQAKKMRLIGAALLLGGVAAAVVGGGLMEAPLRVIFIVAAGGMMIIGPVLIATNKGK